MLRVKDQFKVEVKMPWAMDNPSLDMCGSYSKESEAHADAKSVPSTPGEGWRGGRRGRGV